ncbi:hypothetical protein V511_09655 [Mesotoga sp. Brook.08.YT.4.2.5.1]|nr:hypothetical protein V511_09655 [Mesotoga sp. Brook.08.YT.4.2.5.1]RAO96246.1 hypothetical protein M388_14635 [Mesotoga sp. Brook.08.YT.4.2.5.4.]RDI93710.1 hypothetical protein Q502_03990 [Mesotoga sp. Brook.08.YT.4.2.5.2.]
MSSRSLPHETSEKSVTAEIRRKAPKEHRRTQGWLRQVAMPGEASGDARLPSAGGDFEDCLFAQTSFGFARPIRSIEKEHCRDGRYAHEPRESQSLLKLDARRRKNIGGRKAGFARSQCPEKHPGTQGCLRQEAILKTVCSHRPVSALRDQ